MSKDTSFGLGFQSGSPPNDLEKNFLQTKNRL